MDARIPGLGVLALTVLVGLVGCEGYAEETAVAAIAAGFSAAAAVISETGSVTGSSLLQSTLTGATVAAAADCSHHSGSAGQAVLMVFQDSTHLSMLAGKSSP